MRNVATRLRLHNIFHGNKQMPNDGPRLTEERLRNHLDSNQPMRERLCLALMPLISPYTRECPRRPKGGPDGGRDIEAIHEGSTATWGAVGFRNGGGNDEQARRETAKKFDSDLARALKENSTLQAFVFFTNVDLTPTIVEKLKEKAASSGVTIVDIVDFERLRHALDSPEGLIARLQYLDITMPATEQIALVSKFGNQLQNAVAARFDRVERTLSQMERFLDFQKPIYRLDIFAALEGEHCSSELGTQGVLLKIKGLQSSFSDSAFVLLWNLPEYQGSGFQLVTRPYIWLDENPKNITLFTPSAVPTLSLIAAYCELSLSSGGRRVKFSDLSTITLDAFVTEGLTPFIRRLDVDANGYELFSCATTTATEESSVDFPNNLSVDAKGAKWFQVVSNVKREFTYKPPVPSSRRLRPLHPVKY